MIGKIIIGVGAYLVGSHIHGLLDLTENEKQSAAVNYAHSISKNLVGKVVKATDSDTLYLIWNRGTRIRYDSYQAYINDGKKEIVVLPPEIVDNIGISTNIHIGEQGRYYT